MPALLLALFPISYRLALPVHKPADIPISSPAKYPASTIQAAVAGYP
jgi:hypothetical protein